MRLRPHESCLLPRSASLRGGRPYGHSCGRRRDGAVLLGVLVVIVILALIAYQYSDRMVAEYSAADNSHRFAQARSFADSGVHYAAALLANPDSFQNVLGGNPYDNPEQFQEVVVPDSRGAAGRFTLVAPTDTDDNLASGAYRSGVTDEGSKININALMKRDDSGQRLHDMLVKLPNMTEETAAAIVDWVDADTTPREGGAEDDFYSGLSPGYRCKNGPLDSLDELLLVKGVTRELLYGGDLNRNGVMDGDDAGTDRGWSSYLTIYSREANRDPLGEPLLYLNNNDMAALYQDAGLIVGDDLAKFILLYRQYGPANSQGGQQNLGQSIFSLFVRPKSSNQATVEGKLGEFQPDFNRTPRQKLNSLFDLVGAQVSVPNKDRKKPATVYTTPLNDPGVLKDLLPKLYQISTLSEEMEIPARINVNTAPREVLSCLSELTEGDVERILSVRPRSSSSEPAAPIFQTPVWLATEANLSLQTLRNLEKSITTRAQVYHMQVVGRFENNTGPVARIEAIVDTNFGRPRFLLWRDWTELGKTRLP